MRILIASDLHGSMSSLKFLLDKASETKPDMIVLLGDLVYHGPRNPLPDGYDTRGILTNMPDITRLPFPLTVVRGNCDAEVDVTQMPFAMPEEAWLDVDGLKIYACHGHHIPADPPIPNMTQGTVILRGHTHIPRGETLDSIHFWNPGSLSLPKGGFPKTWAMYENRCFRVMDMAGNTVLEHCVNAA